MATPTHLPVVILRDIWVRKDHIAGAAAPQQGERITKVVKRGERLNIAYSAAKDLIVAESAFEDNSTNRGRRDDLDTEIASLKSQKPNKKELAPA